MMNSDKTPTAHSATPGAILTIADGEQVREVLLDVAGAIIGRSAACDVVLASERVSRRHARIFQDPFARWIVEDLGSQNGVFIGERRVQAHAVLPGERIHIGPFVLNLTQPVEQDIAPDRAMPSSTTLLQGAADMQVVREGAAEEAPLSRASLKELNRLVDRLSELTRPADLYPEVCRYLASAPGTAALVVRLPSENVALPAAPEILAGHLGGKAAGSSAPDATNLYFSRRVLEAMRSSREPVMAKSAHTADAHMSLTITDEAAPRAVLSVPVCEAAESLDALYLDLPLERTPPDLFDFVQAVARQVRFVRKGLLLLEAKAQRQTLDSQLALAREIQTRLMPSTPSDLHGVDVALHYEPAMWVGGDYVDIWRLADGRLAFAVGDVSGKGLPAAMVMSNLQAALRTATSFCPAAADILEHVDRHLERHLPESMFVTLFFGLFSAEDGRLEYVNAGHIPPLLVHPQVGAEWLESASHIVLGVAREPFTPGVVTITPGTGLLVVSDGITEAMSPAGEEFGMTRLEKLMTALEGADARRIVQATTEAARRFRGFSPQRDDITVFALCKK
ncbi:MAG: SpoIIE family protein phosphatase [Planctomycetes bacterium]|nr:SpoIIE family protein phosphatase [Planctomycetota bacterium]